MKPSVAIFSALVLVNLVMTDAQLANIPLKVHPAVGRRMMGGRQTGRRVAGNGAILMSMLGKVEGIVTSSAPSPPPTTASRITPEQMPLSSDPTLYSTYQPTTESIPEVPASETTASPIPPEPMISTSNLPPTTASPVTPEPTTLVSNSVPTYPPTTETSSPQMSVTLAQTLPPATESPVTPEPTTLVSNSVPTYPPTTETSSPQMSVTLAQTLPPATESPTLSPNVKLDGVDRQGGELGEPTVSPAPTVSAAPSTGSPVSVTLAPSLRPTATPVTKSPSGSPVTAPTTATPVTNSPSGSPVTAPTTATPVTKSPSGSPVTAPTTAPPTVSQTNTPTRKPTNRPTRDPTDAPTIPPTNIPTRKPTNIPTDAPTNAPTIPPTPSPTNKLTTNSPTSKTETSKPSASNITPSLTSAPSAQPNALPLIETLSPTVTSIPTAQTAPSVPTLKLKGPVTTTGLKMILTGIGSIPSEPEWESTTSNYYAKVYDKMNSPFTYDHMVQVSITNVGKPARRKRRLNTIRSNTERALQSDTMSVEVTYSQEIWYRSDDPNIDSTTLFDPLLPLSTEVYRNGYVGELKTLQGYEDLTAVSEIFISSDNGGDNSGVDESPPGLTTGAIIGIVVGAAAALIILVIGIAHYKGKKDDEDVDNDEVPSTMEFPNAQGSTVASGMGTGSSIPPSHEDPTVGTLDYDYPAAYGGMGPGEAHSEAGGTLGSRTRQTAADADVDDMAIVSGVTETGASLFSEDPTFDQVYEVDAHEEMIDVYAPAGKLGVVIDTPTDGAPVVHAVKDTSVLAGKIMVGDKLVAVDDTDVRTMTAIKVSKLLSRKSENESRKLTVVRLVKNDWE